jgi:phage tail P2-like protein
MTNLFENNLINIAPSTLVDAETKSLFYAIDQQIINRISKGIEKIKIWSDIMTADSELLDYLAAELRTQYYDDSLSDDIKRNLIYNTLLWYQKTGTNMALEELVSTVFGSGKIVDWYEYNGEPYHFKVSTENPQITGDVLQKFISIIEQVKRKSAVLDGVEIALNTSMNAYYGIKMHTGNVITLSQEG